MGFFQLYQTREKDFYQYYLKNHYNFIYGNKALLLCTIGFIIFKINNFFTLQQRPSQIFTPETIFGKLFMPYLPAIGLYLAIAFLAIIFCIYLILYPNNFWLRIFLTLQLMWLNVAQWSYGFFSHVTHVLLLAHLFSIFIPFKITRNHKEAAIITKTLTWYYAGILITYTFSGLWKWVGLFYKLLLKPTDIHWLHADASLFNASVSFRNYDLPFNLQPLFAYPLFWQISFLLVLFIQTLCVLAAFRPEWRLWVGLALIIFHITNAVVFLTVFIVAPVVIVCLFFPYHYLLKPKH